MPVKHIYKIKRLYFLSYHRMIQMALPAQTAGGQSFHLSRRERSFSTQHGSPANSYLPKTSSRTDRPNRFYGSKLPRTNYVKAAFRELADSFFTCFGPRQTKAAAEAFGREGDISSSTKESSSSSINTSKNFKYSGSYNSYNANVEEPQFSIAEIYKATRNFSMANKIGEGGFGFVYKGLLNNGSLVAVKRAKKVSIEEANLFASSHNRRQWPKNLRYLDLEIGQEHNGLKDLLDVFQCFKTMWSVDCYIVFWGIPSTQLDKYQPITSFNSVSLRNVHAIPAEFMNEIQTLSSVEHLNLVRFLGYLEQDDERIIIIEYISNGTLREHLDGSRGDVLELSHRLDIAIDVAHAVTYLHMYTDHPIIHRDIKSSNILITDKLRAKVSDFGFARYSKDDPAATHVSTQVKGTAGYLDPEYLRTFQLTEKSDVYSFGVLLVELMTGRHPIEPEKERKERITARWAMLKLKEAEAAQAMDPKLRKSAAAYLAVEKVLELAKECLAHTRESRPSMKRCGEVLWGIRKDYRDMEFSFSTSSSLTSSRTLESFSSGNCA